MQHVHTLKYKMNHTSSDLFMFPATIVSIGSRVQFNCRIQSKCDGVQRKSRGVQKGNVQCLFPNKYVILIVERKFLKWPLKFFKNFMKSTQILNVRTQPWHSTSSTRAHTLSTPPPTGAPENYIDFDIETITAKFI